MKKLSLEKMEMIEAGKADYCSTLAMITQNNVISGGALSGAISGFNAGNCGAAGYDFIIEDGWGGGTTTARIIIYKREAA